MPIREESFRIGCGRYLQAPNILAKCGDEVLRLGNAPLIVGGKTALEITRNTIESSVSAVCAKYEVVEHTGTCNEESAIELANFAKQNGLDVIVGVGGGVLMDFAKLIGDFAKLPVMNIPTSSATCAAYTPLSVRYTPDGRTVGSKHYGYEVNAVMADTAVISTQPTRLLLAGVFDALAKFLEIKQRYNEQVTEYPLGLDWAYILSEKSFRELNGKIDKCISDMASGNVTDTVEQMIFTTIAVTGVISGIARGSNQCALAHKFYETTRLLFPETARPYLHGEIVGVGLLLQNHFNGDIQNNTTLLRLMKNNNMPFRISDIGIDSSNETFEEFYRRLCASSAIDENNKQECAQLLESLKYLWGLHI